MADEVPDVHQPAHVTHMQLCFYRAGLEHSIHWKLEQEDQVSDVIWRTAMETQLEADAGIGF